MKKGETFVVPGCCRQCPRLRRRRGIGYVCLKTMGMDIRHVYEIALEREVDWCSTVRRYKNMK